MPFVPCHCIALHCAYDNQWTKSMTFRCLLHLLSGFMLRWFILCIISLSIDLRIQWPKQQLPYGANLQQNSVWLIIFCVVTVVSNEEYEAYQYLFIERINFHCIYNFLSASSFHVLWWCFETLSIAYEMLYSNVADNIEKFKPLALLCEVTS